MTYLSSAPTDINDIYWNGSYWLIAAEDGLFSSDNGENWTQVFEEHIYHINWNGTGWIASARTSDGKNITKHLYTSSDGINWSLSESIVSSSNDNSFISASYWHNGSWILGDSIGRIYSKNSEQWNSENELIFGGYITHVFYDGHFNIVERIDDSIYQWNISQDGKNWEQKSLPQLTTTGMNLVSGITYDNENYFFTASASYGIESFYASQNGTDWTSASVKDEHYNLFVNSAWQLNGQWIVLAQKCNEHICLNGYLYMSVDGSSWEQAVLLDDGSMSENPERGSSSGFLFKDAIKNNDTLFVSSGADISATMITKDGTNWNIVDLGEFAVYDAKDGYWLAKRQSTNEYYIGKTLTSDSSQWIRVSDTYLYDIQKGENGLVAASYSGIYFSSDGLSFDQVANGVMFGANQLSWNGTEWLLVGDDNIASSTNGKDWQKIGVDGEYKYVVTDGENWLVVAPKQHAVLIPPSQCGNKPNGCNTAGNDFTSNTSILHLSRVGVVSSSTKGSSLITEFYHDVGLKLSSVESIYGTAEKYSFNVSYMDEHKNKRSCHYENGLAASLSFSASSTYASIGGFRMEVGNDSYQFVEPQQGGTFTFLMEDDGSLSYTVYK